MMLVSSCIFLLGLVFLLVSELMINLSKASIIWSIVWSIVRDIGVALCSTGLISVAYEVLIRDQLLEDHMNRMKSLLNPDAERLGIQRIFANRTERAEAGLSMDDLILNTQSEMLLCGVVPLQTLIERRGMLTNLVRRGGTVKLLVFDPSSVNVGAMDATLACTPGALAEDLKNIREAIKVLRNALRSFGGEERLIVRCHDTVLPFKMIATDVQSENGTFVVELNGLNLPDEDHASFVLQRQDGGLYHRYWRQVDSLWETARPFDESLPAWAHLSEAGIAVGWQSELYERALKLCAERGIKNAVLYQYSASTLQMIIRDLLRNGWDIELVLEAPEVAGAINASTQQARISGMIETFRCYDQGMKSHLRIRQSHVPNSVRAAVFGDDFIVLGWYYYLAVSAQHNGKLPDLQVNGDGTFGVLIDRSNAHFDNVKDFLHSYESALSADAVGL